ncbi:flagellin [uncultured Rhodospira sp.]|uniref:flagellin n=1 Tax=uncultured Rhodospira sp. TaxID=1936189 RepID=UPI002612DA90|nr:flagellin [uncultured Rhodospira sp.]
MISMSARVGTFAQSTSLVQQMTTLQKRMYETQTQLVTEKKSQDYAGISKQSFRLVSIEAELSSVQRFTQTNNVAEARLSAMNTAVTAVEKRLHDLRTELDLLGSNSATEPLTDEERENLDNVQKYAFAALQDMTYYLNTQADGGYLFSGGRSDQRSVNLSYTSLQDFQNFYDGGTITFPDTRTANVANISVDNGEHGGLAYAGGPPPGTPYTITAGTAAAFDDIPVGATIRLTDSTGQEDVYTVLTNAGAGTLEVSDGRYGTNPNTFAADATLETISYYGGDDLVTEHRVSERRTVDLGINAKDPAFEKAIRAMGFLAQGNLYTDVSAADSTNLTFTAAVPGTDGGTVTAGTAGAFSDIPVGAEVSFNGTANNGGIFLVTANDGDTLTFADPTDPQYADYSAAALEGPVAADTSSFSAFRIDDARTLLNDAISHDRNLTSEQSSDVKEVLQRLGFVQVTVHTALEESQSYEAYLKNRVSDIENVDTTEAAVRLQKDAQALEIAYQSYARISELSLQNYLRL